MRDCVNELACFAEEPVAQISEPVEFPPAIGDTSQEDGYVVIGSGW